MTPYIVTVKRGERVEGYPIEDGSARPPLVASRRAVATLDEAVVDLGEPDGVSRYWLIVTDHANDHPDVHAAAVHARVTGSIGCKYNEARVIRLLGDPLPESGTVGPLPDGTVIEVEPTTFSRLRLEDSYKGSRSEAEIIAAYNEAQG